MLICKDGCGAENLDTAAQCQHCGRNLRSALRLHNPNVLVRNYQIKRIIGWGGFGAVYEAEDIGQSGSRVALKESFDPNGMISFQGEFTALQQHPHPHLPRYEEIFLEQGISYLVMEFIPGQSLEEVQGAAGGPLLEKQVLGFALQICDVLNYLHHLHPPIFHRDIKPANIRLTPSGLIKLVDFGLFKQGIATTQSSRMGMTPAYAPVEQHPLAPGHTDQRSDIYSLGATLYHLLTGQTPASSFDRIQQSSADLLIPPRRLNSQISPHVATVITKAMSLKPADRYLDIVAFQQALLRQSPIAFTPVRLAPASWIPEMVEVPAGPFFMGSTKQQIADVLSQKAIDRTGASVEVWDYLAQTENPQRSLNLPTYWIGRTPVTVAQFRPFVEGDGYINRVYWTESGWHWRKQIKITRPAYWDNPQWNGESQPVVGVYWHEAVAYCRWLSAQIGQTFSLPTEAEWEKAARGPDGRIYPWGNTWESGRANSYEAGVGVTTPVGQYPAGASPYGVLDMAGNVWEWMATIWQESYYQAEDEWEAVNLEQTVTRVLRGGSYYNGKRHMRGASRHFEQLSFGAHARHLFSAFGLRVVSRSSMPRSNP